MLSQPHFHQQVRVTLQEIYRVLLTLHPDTAGEPELADIDPLHPLVAGSPAPVYREIVALLGFLKSELGKSSRSGPLVELEFNRLFGEVALWMPRILGYRDDDILAVSQGVSFELVGAALRQIDKILTQHFAAVTA